MTNKRIRKKMIDKGLKQWELARLMGISEATMYRKLRDELPEEEQDRIIQLIEEKEDHE